MDLRAFSLDGAGNKPFRLVLNRFARAGLRFRVVPRGEVPALLPALREVSMVAEVMITLRSGRFGSSVFPTNGKIMCSACPTPPPIAPAATAAVTADSSRPCSSAVSVTA